MYCLNPPMETPPEGLSNLRIKYEVWKRNFAKDIIQQVS